MARRMPDPETPTGRTWILHGTLASAPMAHQYRDVFGVSGVLGSVVPLLAGLARLLGRTLPG